MVLEFFITSEYVFIVSVLISKPIQPSGISLILQCFILASFEKLSAITASVGIYKLTPFVFAFCNNSFAKSNLSSSHNDLPIAPPIAFTNVNAMPPPIKMLLALFINCSIIKILSLTFAPPTIAVKGASAPFITLSILAISLAITYPKHFASDLKNWAITAVDACARCAVPKASLT